MNSFPVIFARSREGKQLAQIRSLFNTKSSLSPVCPLVPQTSKIILKPKEPIRLKRPATARALPAKSASTSFVDRSATKAIRRIRASPIPAPAPMSVTPPPLELLREECKEPHHQLNHSKSSEFLEAVVLDVRATQESEMWTLSNSDISPNQPVADLSPFQTMSPMRRPSPLRLREGEAVLPTQFTCSHYFMKLFGTPLKQSEAKEALLSHLTSAMGVHIAESSHTRITHSAEEVYVIVTGPQAPLSPCCSASVVFAFSRTGGGKVLCAASYCPSRTLSNFHLPVALRAKLWTDTTAVSMSSRELSTHVRKGSYKTMSLRREMEKRSQTAGTRQRTQRLLETKPIFTNEKLKFVTPVKPSTALRLPTDLQIDTLTPANNSASSVSSNPLLRLLQRSNSRHNAVRRRCTTDELLSHLSSLLKIA